MNKKYLLCVIILWLAFLISAQDFATWQTQAAAGNARAQYNLGLTYYNGTGVTQNLAEAARWFEQAAEQGQAQAAANLGLMYFKGEGVPVDHAKAVRFFRIGADGGDAIAQFCLAAAYATGDQVTKDPAESAKWLRLSATQGNPTAQFNLGNALAFGDGVTADPAEAGAWWYKAGTQGNEKAKNNLANLDFWEKATVAGDSGTQCWLGFAMLLNGDGKAGMDALHKAGEAGYVYAQTLLASAYARGTLAGNSVEKDQKEYTRWTNLAANQGDAESQYNLGMDYFQGVGVKKDAKLALEWLMKAASQGYVDAYYNLGSIFLEGYKGTEGRLKETMLPNFPEHCS
jgi:hypothetical protein